MKRITGYLRWLVSTALIVGLVPLGGAIASAADAPAQGSSATLNASGATFPQSYYEEAIGLRTIQSELAGLARELRGAAMETLAEALDAAATSLSSADALKNTPEPLPMGRRILVLDDSEVTCDLIAVALEGVGCVVTVTTRLGGALQRLV